MKEEILSLRDKGKSYDEISNLLNCAKSTIAYHCSSEIRTASKEARNRNRKKQREFLKLEFGGKCTICGYNKCLSALDFHHKDPKKKLGSVGELHSKKGKKYAYEEAKKCILICSNCHHEIHEKNLSNVTSEGIIV